uniref:Mannose-6-phosphate isomerase n=1 Tax=Hanseniaspora osmophila TaxID=56408 RepID=A0A1E5R4N4_9ASCO
MSEQLFRLDAGFQQYGWGKIGSSSAVAQFAHHSDPSVKIDESKPYAELWMGTHSSVPSYNHDTKEPLSKIITEHPQEYLGSSIINKFESKTQLPFLFKVLSIEKVLSIQAHPDKALARVLRANDPKNYPDDNHKPEMAIAVTDFEGFCGFKPLETIADELNKIPEFKAVIGEELAAEFIANIKPSAAENSSEYESNRKLLQKVFGKVMNSKDDFIVEQSKLLIKRAQEHPECFTEKDLPALLLNLNEQFPNDIGLFCGGLLLNHCQLKAGEAIFLQAKDPHAYISGDIIECMAASDNVVRAGFTPKFKDVKNLVEMLTYQYGSVESQKMVPENFDRSSGQGKSLLYNPPIDEFAVVETTFKGAQGGVRSFKGLQGPSIVITTKGNGFLKNGDVKLRAEPGYVFFIAPGTEVDFISEDEDFTTYRAFVEAN